MCSVLYQVKHTLERLEGNAGHALVKEADRTGADFIVTGSRGHSTLRRTLMGSVSDYIMHHSHVPVLVCKHEDLHHKHNNN